MRTTIADDVVWLAYALDEYCRTTGDASILDEDVPFISGPSLDAGQHDAFFQPDPSSETATVYEHAARALDLAIGRTGPNGLPLFLGGDWNDGMNRVGEGGKGESVWLGWFLLHALKTFAAHAKERGDDARMAAWGTHADRLKAALEGPGWDGSYYRRGFFDDGTALGSASATECRIDSIAQSWCVLSGAYDGERANAAMDAVLGELVDPDAGIIRLFTPPFDKTGKDPGYIKAYPAGVRENGGQYTHAATWVVCALAALGRADDAYACFGRLNPIVHAADRRAAEHYRVEPYVVAADIYAGGSYGGRGGWTWYTGSAGWLYRAAVEGILGIRLRGERLVVDPALPTDWPGFKATLRHLGRIYAIEVERAADGKIRVTVDGREIEDATAGALLEAEPDAEREAGRARIV